MRQEATALVVPMWVGALLSLDGRAGCQEQRRSTESSLVTTGRRAGTDPSRRGEMAFLGSTNFSMEKHDGMVNTFPNSMTMQQDGEIPEERQAISAKREDELLTPEDVSGWFKVTLAWLYDHTTRSKPIVPHLRLGGHLRFRRPDLERWLDSQLQTSCA